MEAADQPPPFKRCRTNSSSPVPSDAGSPNKSPALTLPTATASTQQLPTSSITALGARFGAALAAGSSSGGTNGAGPSRHRSHARQIAQRGDMAVLELMDSSDVEDDDVYAGFRPSQAQQSNEARAARATSSQVKMDIEQAGPDHSLQKFDKGKQRAEPEEQDSTAERLQSEAEAMDLDGLPSPSPTLRAEEDLVVPPSPAKASGAQLTPNRLSSPSKSQLFPSPSQSGPSATQAKRSKAEIEERKRAAQAKRQAAIDAQATAPLTQAVKRSQTQERHLAFAKETLASYGFAVGGMSRYGSGRGGLGDAKPESGAGGEGSVANDPQWDGPGQQRMAGEFVADERCSDEQKEVLKRVKEGGNVFFTGSAGVGKSFLLKEITRLLEHERRPFQVTATTGIAALQVSGVTLHSFAGIGLGKESVSALYDRIYGQKERRDAWLKTQVLIIDEVSMIDPMLFTKLSVLGKLLRRSNKPFGGLQLIVSGDFYQLPPVSEKHPVCMRCGEGPLEAIPLCDSRLPYEDSPRHLPAPKALKCSDRWVNRKRELGCNFEWREVTFVFETAAWAECSFLVMELTKVFRQSDPDFVRVLEKFRRGICDDDCMKMIEGCGTALDAKGSIKPTNLYPLRAAVNSENEREFKKLNEHAFTFIADDTSRGPRGADLMKNRLKDVPPDPVLKLKKGAQVLLLANLSVAQGLVNGSRGVIVDWIARGDTYAPELSESQDGTAKMEPGGGYRLNGGRSLAPKKKTGAGGGGFGGEDWREKAADDFMDKQVEQFCPVVLFAVGVTLVIKPHAWVIDIDRNNSVARTQFPLALAWALTIHKSQGQSLDAVGVRLTSTFEKGQAYVALSRCRTPAGMKVAGFKAGHIMAHETVIAYYKRIAEKKPYLTSYVPPVNPMAYLPDHSPLVYKVRALFGFQPRPLPIGSAVLAPGQAPPGPPPPPPPFVDRRQRTPTPQQQQVGHDGAPPTWQDLLAQAARAFAASTSESGLAPFVAEATQLGGDALAALPVLNEEEDLAEDSQGGPELARSCSAPEAGVRPRNGLEWQKHWREQARLRDAAAEPGTQRKGRQRNRRKRVGA